MKRQRTSSRRRVRLLARLEGHTSGFTLNVGAGGFCVLLNRALAPGTPVAGTIQLERSEVRFDGRVAWIAPGDNRLRIPSRIGVSFNARRAELDGPASPAAT